MSIPFLLVPLDSAPYFRASILGVLAFATACTGLSSTFLHYVGKPGIEPGTSGYEGCRRSHHFELQPVVAGLPRLSMPLLFISEFFSSFKLEKTRINEKLIFCSLRRPFFPTELSQVPDFLLPGVLAADSLRRPHALAFGGDGKFLSAIMISPTFRSFGRSSFPSSRKIFRSLSSCSRSLTIGTPFRFVACSMYLTATL